ncbi:putative metallo-hydrolase YflN [Abditibacteriota bacterium]|nr:putative metallo-hydrolase YflN [Abditibacteriota bacterium]
MSLQPVAPHVWRINIFNFVNAYFVRNAEGEFVLIDTGVRPALTQLKAAAAELGRPPIAILLTHGHFDHAGCAGELARAWNVPVYAGRLEKPFLTGAAAYPPGDPTVGGALAQVSRAIPPLKFDISDVLEIYPQDGKLDVLKGWQVIETPGHSPGHISLWHEDDRILLAGDALCTADMDSVVGMTTLKPTQFARGGTPFVPDWKEMKHSLGKLADLEPATVAAGHGHPMTGGSVPEQLRDFYHEFAPPEHGRYVGTPARTDESGVTFLPPAPPDPLPRNVAIGALAGAAAFAILGRGRK